MDFHCLPFSDVEVDETALTGDRTATMLWLFWVAKLKTGYLSGDHAEALAAAEEAIRAVRENGFVQNEGLAGELAAPWEFSVFRLAKTARQSAVLGERNQLAGEIHDSLAQLFTGISMQPGIAKDVLKTGDGLS